MKIEVWDFIMRIVACLFTVLIAGVTTHAPAVAKSTIKPVPNAGHPGVSVKVSGSGFGDSEAIDVYIDTVDTLLLVSSGTGTFNGAVTIPTSESPGAHYITAIGRRTGDAAQAAFNVTTPWAEQGFGAASKGWNPWENTLTPSVVPSLGTLWTSSGASYSTPAVANGDVYVATYNGFGVEALNAGTGALVWSVLTAEQFGATPAVSGALVYIGSATGLMSALNIHTGATVWSMQLSSKCYFTSAVVANGLVYAGCTDNNVYTFSATTGEIVGVFATSGVIYSAPAVFDGIVYAGSQDGYVYAFNATTDTLVWKYKTDNEVIASPAVSNGLVYIGAEDNNGTVYALGAKTGTLSWSAVTGPGPIYAGAAVANGIVYVGNTGQNVYALNARTGAADWVFFTDGGVESPPVVADGVVYVQSVSGTLYALSASSGTVLWSELLGYPTIAGPAISDGGVFLATGEGGQSPEPEVIAFAPSAGNGVMRRRQFAPKPQSLRPDMSLAVSR